MRQVLPHKTLEERLTLLEEKAQDRYLSVKTILQVLSGKGRPLLLIVLSFPFCQPFQIPGLSIFFGLMIAFIGIRIAFGKHLWIPQSFLSKKISSKTIGKITRKSLRLIGKMKRWVHPRLDWMCYHPIMPFMNGLLLFVLGILLALPLPIPFTNLLTGWSLFFLSLGLLEDDGLMILFGYILSLLDILFFISLWVTIKGYLFSPI